MLKKNYDHWLRTCQYPHCRGEERLSWRKQDLWTHVYFCSVENFFHNWPIWCVSTLRKPFRLKVVRHFKSCPTLSKPYLPWPTSREWAPLWHQVWKTNEKKFILQNNNVTSMSYIARIFFSWFLLLSFYCYIISWFFIQCVMLFGYYLS